MHSALATTARLPLTPTLEEARALARDYNVIPLRHTFIDDCETPVSAFLKLRGPGPGVPARVRRAGTALRPLLVPRLPPAGDPALRGRSRVRCRRPTASGASWTAADPFAAVADYLSAYRIAPLDGPAAVRRRRGRHVRLRPRPNGRAPAGAEPRRHRNARHGADGLRRADRVRPPAPPGDDHGERVRRGRRRRRRRPTSARRA